MEGTQDGAAQAIGAPVLIAADCADPSCSRSDPLIPVEGSNKRRLSESSDDGQQIKRKAPANDSDVTPSKHQDQSASICGLSDEVLLNILKYLDSASLVDFGGTCERFQLLISDYCLWYKFDFLAKPMCASDIKKNFKYMHAKTNTFRVAGTRSLYPALKSNYPTLTNKMIQSLRNKCPMLRHMTIADAMLDIEKYSIHGFPNGLTSLTLRNCESYALSRSFFNRIDTHLPLLTDLRLENCPWFETHQLIAMSKLPQLKLLSLRGCRNLRECVPYGSVATRFGFQKLETLDLRDTPIADSEVQCFNITKTLRNLLIECPKEVKEEPVCRYCENVSIAADVDTPSTSSSSSASSSSSSAPYVSKLFQCARHYPKKTHPIQQVINVVVDMNGQHLIAQPPQYAEQRISVQQQLIVVRNLQMNEVGQANPRHQRLAWEVVYDPELANHYGVYSSNSRRYTPSVTDRGICSFGRTRSNLQPNMVWIRADERMAETLIETLVVRGFKGVTDISLRHLAECAPNLRSLDVSNTSVTVEGVNYFREAKPACLLIHNVNVKQPTDVNVEETASVANAEQPATNANDE